MGYVSAGDFQVVVQPRFPVRNLFYLLNVLEEMNFKEEEVNVSKSTEILDTLVASFIEAASYSTSRGLLHGYREIEEQSMTLRGRLLFSKQLVKGAQTLIPFEIKRDEYSEDIPENQLLKRALRKVVRFKIGSSIFINRAKSLVNELDGVSDVQGEIRYTESRLNRHYWKTLRIAKLVDEGNGFNENLGDLTINGFHIDMFRLFEQFSFRELSYRIRNKGDSAFAQKRLELDLEGNYKEIPDLVWQSEGRPKHVIDFKYKNPVFGDTATPSLEDIRQVSSYASLLGLQNAHLVYGVSLEMDKILTRLGVTVFVHGIDLRLKPKEISNRLDKLIIEIEDS